MWKSSHFSKVAGWSVVERARPVWCTSICSDLLIANQKKPKSSDDSKTLFTTSNKRGATLKIWTLIYFIFHICKHFLYCQCFMSYLAGWFCSFSSFRIPNTWFFFKLFFVSYSFHSNFLLKHQRNFFYYFSCTPDLLSYSSKLNKNQLWLNVNIRL